MGHRHSALTSNAAVTPLFRQALDLRYIHPGLHDYENAFFAGMSAQLSSNLGGIRCAERQGMGALDIVPVSKSRPAQGLVAAATRAAPAPRRALEPVSIVLPSVISMTALQ